MPWAILGAVCAPTPVSAQSGSTAVVGTASGSVRIDGVLEPGEWPESATLAALTMVEPLEGAVPSFATRVWIMADPGHIYIGVRADDPEPAGIVSYSKARDSELRSEDHLKLVLDPFLDGQSGYVFAVNPGGARYDALVAEQGLGENASWDGVWEASTRRDETGWTAEIRIPIRSISFDDALDGWGFNLERRIQRTQEVVRWASPTRDAPLTRTATAGRITGLPAFDTGLGLTVRPSLAGGWSKAGPDLPWEGDLEPSLDVFQRLGSGSSAVVTVNTDFAETEVDTRRTNLTRFPLFFPEKRTFFLEGADIFDFGAGMNTFYNQDIVPFFTRRIGLVQGEEVPVRAGAKVSGRMGRTSYGALMVGTGGVDSLTSPTRMGAVRIKRTVLEQSSVGMLATFGDPLDRSGSWVAGADAVYNTSRFLGGRNLIVGGWGLVAGRDSLGGDRTAVGAIVDYPNDVWDVWASWKRIGESFDPSLGFVPRKGVHLGNVGVNYRWWSPTPAIRNLYFELVPIFAWDLGGRIESYRIFTAPVNVRLESGDRIELNVQPQGERLAVPFEIADGIFIAPGSYDWVRYRAEVDFAGKRLLSGRVSWWFGPFYDGRVSELSVRLAINPSDFVTFELTGARNSGSLSAGEILQEVYGSRVRVNFSPDLQVSAFAQYERESREFGLNTRLRWTFHPLGDLFLIYNHNALDEALTGWRTEAGQLLLKVQYAFRS